jgi:hypothetical protein
MVAGFWATTAGDSGRRPALPARSSAFEDLPGRGIRARPRRTKAEVQEVRTPAFAGAGMNYEEIIEVIRQA